MKNRHLGVADRLFTPFCSPDSHNSPYIRSKHEARAFFVSRKETVLRPERAATSEKVLHRALINTVATMLYC